MIDKDRILHERGCVKMERMRILAIAPYPEFQELTKQVSHEFHDIEIDVFTGDRENAVAYIQTLPIQNYSVIISRGGTAEYLRSSVSLPVIEVEVSVYDMLRTLKQAEALHVPFAVMGYLSVVKLAKNLCEILKYDNIEIIEVTSENIAAQMRLLAQKGISLIVGDVMSVEAASKYGIRSILITSTTDSVRKAIRDSVQICKCLKSSLSQIQLLQSVINSLSASVVLLDRQGGIILANAACKSIGYHALREALTPHIATLAQQKSFYKYQTLNHTNYSVMGQTITADEAEYYAFFLTETSKLLSNMQDISIEDLSDFPQNIHFLFSNSDYMQSVQKNIQLFRDSHTPIHITGQIGTEKTSVARYLHWNSSHKDHPFIRIRCDLLTPAHWDVLHTAANSPINECGCTLFFENVHLLSPELQTELDSYLSGTFALKNQYIVSSTHKDLQAMVLDGSFSAVLFDNLVGFTIHMPSLNERREDIPPLANLFVAKLNGEYGKQVVGFEEDAMDILKQYHWTLNLEQFQKVLSQLVLSCGGYYITAEDVNTVLNEIQPIDLMNSRLLPIDLTQTLDKIEQDIIRHILAEEDMNQSAAAKRLGIGRSTIWRKLRG